MLRVSIFLLLIIVSINASATQRINVKDGDQIKIVISYQDPSRLAIEGEGRLQKIWSPQGYLDLEADKVKGEAFFKATNGAPQSFSFFVRDDFGNTFTIVATQDNVPSQTIILSPEKKQRTNNNDGDTRKAQAYKKMVNSLFKAMFNEKSLNGYLINQNDTDVPLWQETKIKLVESYTGRKLIGQIYEVTNISDELIIFHESEFFNFGDYVTAVGLEKLEVDVKETTRLFVVRDNKKED